MTTEAAANVPGMSDVPVTIGRIKKIHRVLVADLEDQTMLRINHMKTFQLELRQGLLKL